MKLALRQRENDLLWWPSTEELEILMLFKSQRLVGDLIIRELALFSLC